MPAVPPKPLSQNLSCAEPANIREAFAKSRSIKLSRIPTVALVRFVSAETAIAPSPTCPASDRQLFIASPDAWSFIRDGEPYLCRGGRNQFLEARIVAQWFKHCIKAAQESAAS
jgi:hypothetical protein